MTRIRKDVNDYAQSYQRDHSLGGSYYPAERPVMIDIPELKKAGIYDLEIGATLRAGGSWSTQVWFYHHN